MTKNCIVLSRVVESESEPEEVVCLNFGQVEVAFADVSESESLLLFETPLYGKLRLQGSNSPESQVIGWSRNRFFSVQDSKS